LLFTISYITCSIIKAYYPSIYLVKYEYSIIKYEWLCFCDVRDCKGLPVISSIVKPNRIYTTSICWFCYSNGNGNRTIVFRSCCCLTSCFNDIRSIGINNYKWEFFTKPNISCSIIKPNFPLIGLAKPQHNIREYRWLCCSNFFNCKASPVIHCIIYPNHINITGIYGLCYPNRCFNTTVKFRSSRGLTYRIDNIRFNSIYYCECLEISLIVITCCVIEPEIPSIFLIII